MNIICLFYHIKSVFIYGKHLNEMTLKMSIELASISNTWVKSKTIKMQVKMVTEMFIISDLLDHSLTNLDKSVKLLSN